MKLEGWRARMLMAFAYYLVRLWTCTLRFQFTDGAGVSAAPIGRPFICAFWHNRVLLVPHVIRNYLPHPPGAALVSASRDGFMIGEFVGRFGFQIVRGSSSRRGVTAIMQLAEVLAEGRIVGISPDGPRGPVYELGPGTVFLAQKSSAPVLPIGIDYSSCWRIKSWDRFILPKPFSRVHVKFGPLQEVKATTTEAEFETERHRLQDAMMALVERR